MARDKWLDALHSRLAKAQHAAGRSAVDQFAPFAKYREDPVGFVRDVLGATSATRRSDGHPYQEDILRDVAEFPRVAVMSGHGVGKTTEIAWLTLWWLLTRSLSRVVLVAPQFDRQVRAINFAEIRRWVRQARLPLPLEVLTGRVVVEGYGPEWGAFGVPATEPDRIEGFHSDHTLLVIDETKGVPQDVYDALQGVLSGTGDTRLVVCSTPGGVEGPFYRIITRGGDAWRIHRLSSEDSSNVDPAWCAERAREWGRDSPLYQARVLGQFADAGEGVLFPLSLLERATVLGRAAEGKGEVTIGVDVARSLGGDQNCVCVARGGTIQELVVWRSPDTMATVNRVIRAVAEYGPRRIRVDESGVGAGVVDRLRQMGYPVEGVAFGGGASDSTRFKNRRAEMFWGLREALMAGTAMLPDDDELAADLSALRYAFDGAGRIVLESKDDCRRRLGRSPDRGDAVALAIRTGGRPGGQWRAGRVLLGPNRVVVANDAESPMGHPLVWPSPFAV